MKFTIRRASRTTRSFRTHPRAGVLAFALLGLVQLLISTAVPLSEGRAQTQIGAHIERQSERRHYVHNEATCAACVARHLTGPAPLPAPIALHASLSVGVPPAAPLLPPNDERRDPSVARAPPAPAPLG